MDIGTYGIWGTCFDQLAPGETADLVAELEEQGWGALWFGEAYGREAFTQAQQLLSLSSRMAVATGIANVWARDAMAANAASRTLRVIGPTWSSESLSGRMP